MCSGKSSEQAPWFLFQGKDQIPVFLIYTYIEEHKWTKACHLTPFCLFCSLCGDHGSFSSHFCYM